MGEWEVRQKTIARSNVWLHDDTDTGNWNEFQPSR